MTPEQTIEVITVGDLLNKVRSLREKNFRLVQISATRLPDQVELTYSFDLDFRFVSLRISIPPTDSRLPSISSIYGCAVLYENEIHDLFNVIVDGLALDFGGNFYKTSVKFPFGSTKPPVVKPAAPAVKPPAAPQ
jgi:ech hydrogenase subunit D